MEKRRLKEILGRFSGIRLLVLGDYFLDQYLVTDPRLAEISVETGLEARQVVAVRNSPGAAGTVCSNLAALGVKTEALGIAGEDGNGYELVKGLGARGVGTGFMLRTSSRFTPTYTKPMKRLADGREEEMERIDIKNRIPTPPALESEIIERLGDAVGSVDGIIVGDQVEEEDCGVVTRLVREELSRLACRFPEKVFFADSRARIGKFSDLMIKPNEKEAGDAVGIHGLDERELLDRLFSRARRPVFLTRGERGIAVFDGQTILHCPAVPVSGPIDIVGAGDSATAGIVSALCVGAGLQEAAEVGNLVASVTIRKLGTTGTASKEEVLGAFESAFSEPRTQRFSAE